MGPGSYFDPQVLMQMFAQPYFAGQEDPQQVAMKGFPATGQTLDDLVTEHGGGSGARGGSLPAVRAPQAKPEMMPPQRGMGGTGMADIDWAGTLRANGFHDLQIKNMSPQQIQEAAMKIQHTRLGPMLGPLRELGYGPAQLMRMTPQDAYNAIKGKFVSQPSSGPSRIESLLKFPE